MVEITGTSCDNYDNAAKNAIDQLVEKGERVHYYREQMRGINSSGTSREFKVVLKVAISI